MPDQQMTQDEWTVEQYRKAQTDLGRLALAHEVFEAVFQSCESFLHDDHVGGNLAYLMGAIVEPSGSGCIGLATWDDELGHPRFLELLRTNFPPEHPVWKHIEIMDD